MPHTLYLLLMFVLLLSAYNIGQSLGVPSPNLIITDRINHGKLYAKRPVIIDTDIGSYMDDTFAIVFAALNKDLDIKLIVTCSDDTTARAKVTARLLNIIGRNDIPIGIGFDNKNKTVHNLFDWAAMENLSNYRGGVYEDGIGKMAEVIADSPMVVDIIAIGPMTNFPLLIKKYPESVKNARVMAMAGSINHGYHGSVGQIAEYNVAECPWCFDMLLNAGWKITITPLDTCGTLRLDNHHLQHMLEANQASSYALASSLLFYCLTDTTVDKCDLQSRGSPTLYDAVATLLTLPGTAEEFLQFNNMMLRVNSTGFTVEDQKHGTPVRVAISWKDEANFADYLVAVLTQMPW